jgi:hypothetical protein
VSTPTLILDLLNLNCPLEKFLLFHSIYSLVQQVLKTTHPMAFVPVDRNEKFYLSSACDEEWLVSFVIGVATLFIFRGWHCVL